MFTCSQAITTEEVDKPLCIYSHGEFLGMWCSNFAIFWYTRRSPTREQRGVITALYLVTLDIDILGVVNNII